MPDLGAREVNDYTWLIYKHGSFYKAHNGLLGYTPTDGISTSLDTVWAYIRSNFNLANEETSLSGIIRFGRGIFDFTTDEMLIDNAMQSVSNKGPIITGMKNSTALRFIPSSPVNSGIHIKSLAGTIIQNLDIAVTDDITNAINLDGSAAITDATLLENLRIFHNNPTGTPRLAGSRAIYIHQTSDTDPETGSGLNTMHLTTLRRLYIKEFETAIKTRSLGNVSFIIVDGLFSWMNRRGIDADFWTIQSTFSNLHFQAHDSEVDYGISMSGQQNVIDNIISDLIDESGTALIILQSRSNNNKISGVMNSGGNNILDYSGNITNEYENYAGFGNPNLKSKEKFGRWYLIASNGRTYVDGLLDVPYAEVDVAGAYTFNTIEGMNIAWTATADTPSASSQGGMYGTLLAPVTSRLQPIFYCRFGINSSSTTRLFIGLTADIGAPGNITDTYKTAVACFGIGIATAGGAQPWKVISGDGTGSAVSTNYLDSAAASVSATADIHDLWICGDGVGSSWKISIDNLNTMSFTTAADIPGVDTQLTPILVMQRVSTNNRILTLYDMKLRCRA